jgi:hypothetical protein
VTVTRSVPVGAATCATVARVVGVARAVPVGAVLCVSSAQTVGLVEIPGYEGWGIVLRD